MVILVTIIWVSLISWGEVVAISGLPIDLAYMHKLGIPLHLLEEVVGFQSLIWVDLPLFTRVIKAVIPQINLRFLPLFYGRQPDSFFDFIHLFSGATLHHIFHLLLSLAQFDLRFMVVV